MVTTGNNISPGIISTVESATSTTVNVSAAAQVALIGQADLDNGTATANTVYTVRTPVKARSLFGAGSMLAEAVVDALTEGAYPVYAIATAETSVSTEDLGTNQNGTLANAPVSELSGDVVFTVDGSPQTLVVTYGNPSAVVLDTGETAFNPVTAEFVHDDIPTSSSVDYVHYDYNSAIAALEADVETTTIVDVVGILTENSSVVSEAKDAAARLYSDRKKVVVIAGASPLIADTSTFTHSYDTSRLALVYPSRNADNMSLIGSYVGLRAKLGINSSPIFKRLKSQTSLAVTLSQADIDNLVEEKVIPLSDETKGAKIYEDLTCVADDNTEEDNMRQVLHRLIVDYTQEQTDEVSERFIGELHLPSARNSLRSNLVARLSKLMDLQAITAFTVTVEEIDALSASVDVGIKTVSPLRNIYVTITAGDVQ